MYGDIVVSLVSVFMTKEQEKINFVQYYCFNCIKSTRSAFKAIHCLLCYVLCKQKMCMNTKKCGNCTKANKICGCLNKDMHDVPHLVIT